MIDERMLKARMLNLLKGAEEELPALCEKLGANPRETTVALLSTMKTVVHMINDLAEKGCWIPCSERLPDEGAVVLVSLKEDEYDDWLRLVREGYHDGVYWCDMDGDNFGLEVIAWMPLPEPYKKGDKEWQDLT